jgi:hypothetical protein
MSTGFSMIVKSITASNARANCSESKARIKRSKRDAQK